ncbi:MAG: hypothetical protein AAGF12_22140 [Myxococcota bacterium]
MKPAVEASNPPVGQVLEWRLELPGKNVLSSEEHRATIAIELQDRLRKPSYALRVGPVSPDLYRRVAGALRATLSHELDHVGAKSEQRHATLWLGWRRRSPLGLPTRGAPNSFKHALWLTDVRLRTGEHFFSLDIRATTRGYARVSTRLANLEDGRDLSAAVLHLAERASLDVAPASQQDLTKILQEDASRDDHHREPQKEPVPPSSATETVLGALGRVERLLVEKTQKLGRGMVHLRGDTLFAGPSRIALDRAVDLTDEDSGLLHVSLRIEPQPTARDTYEAVLLGRPDLSPGDVVKIPVPPTLPTLRTHGVLAVAESVLGPLVRGADTDETVLLYVQSLVTRVTSEGGYSTRLVGVEVRKDFVWDPPGPTATRSPAMGASPGQSTANAVTGLIRRAADRFVGTFATVSRTHGSEQLTDLVVGLTKRRGERLGSRTRKADKKGTQWKRTVYATPFAWGAYGLVLPRYPGTRVVTMKLDEELVDVGAVWGNEGPNDQAADGDYWLSLPADVPASRRAQEPDVEASPHRGKASNDLIDADGNRSLEARGLVLAVGDDALRDAGDRPAHEGASSRLAARGMRLLHVGTGSEIVLRENGDIEINAAGDLVLSAKNVQVKVEGTMNVDQGAAT